MSLHSLLVILKTINEILVAGIAITAFSILLYAMTFNLRDRVVHSFANILLCVVVVFTCEAIGSSADVDWEIDFWLRIQWVGIIILPAAYVHFSDAVLSTTGALAVKRRRLITQVFYGISIVFLILLPTGYLVGPLVLDQQPAFHLQRTTLTGAFTLFYAGSMVVAWINFVRAYSRTVTPTSQRRMGYLLTGAIAPALGSYPYLLYSSSLAVAFPSLFWIIAIFSNVLVGGLIVVMAYSISFFGVAWPDRVIKSRLFKWIMRGPVTASVTLASVTLVRRAGVIFGSPYTALVPIVMVVTVLLFEYLITITGPFWEQKLFHGGSPGDLRLLNMLEERLLTTSDVRQFLEAIVAAVCDRLQARSAFVAAVGEDGLEMVVSAGEEGILRVKEDVPRDLIQVMKRNGISDDYFSWGEYYLFPLHTSLQEGGHLTGLLGVLCNGELSLSNDQKQALNLLKERTNLALQNRIMQNKVFESLMSLTPEVERIQRLRAAARYDTAEVLRDEIDENPGNFAQWIKDALNHYWGGPRLTDSPLIRLKVVQDAIGEHEGNPANALRFILRQAVDQTRPEGQRRFTGEWLLYNILEMRFIEGRKIREIAMKLAISEADLYRKQRVAIETVAKAITEMEQKIHQAEGTSNKAQIHIKKTRLVNIN